MPTGEGATRALHVLGLAGSPRRHGNTDALLERALAGAREAGATTALLVLSELNIRACTGCAHCSEHGECRIQDDDMPQVYEALDRAERIVLASPIQFGTVSSDAKLMIDRCQRYWARKYVLKLPPVARGRRGLFLSVGGYPKGERFFECAALCARVWFATLGVKLAATLFRPAIDERAAIQRHPDLLEEAYRLGRALVEG